MPTEKVSSIRIEVILKIRAQISRIGKQIERAVSVEATEESSHCLSVDPAIAMSAETIR